MGREPPGQRGPPAAASQPANGTLMARAATLVILCRVFCLVELRGLEPLTPCVQTGHAGVRGACLGVSAQVSDVRSALATAPKRA